MRVVTVVSANASLHHTDPTNPTTRLGLVEKRYKRILETFIGNGAEVEALIDASALTDECKGLYKAHVRDRIRALSHSMTKMR